ncbi:hypothetical protein JCM1841_000860 [Sporobolomyces salmonicolor]
MVKKVLIVFDFDCSPGMACDGLHQDTDRYVFEVLAPHLRVSLRAAKATTQWTDNVAQHLVKLHQEGKTRADVEGALQGLPVHPAMKRGVQAVKARVDPQATFLCLSNSNSVFIDTILRHHGLENQFDEIITNPAHFRDDGLLELKRRVDPNGPQHNCTVGCSPNMCKGAELEEFMKRHGGWAAFDQVVYVGDGGNDYCPLKHLRSGDLALVRMYRELSRRITKEGDALRCTVVPWGGAWEVEKILTEQVGK